MANHEQDQAPGTGPAGSEARDSEDEGTFRWPTTGLPKIFGRQSAEEEEETEPPDAGTGGTPSAEQAADREHALRGAPPPYRAPFNRAAYGHLLVPSPVPDAGDVERALQLAEETVPLVVNPGTEEKRMGVPRAGTVAER